MTDLIVQNSTVSIGTEKIDSLAALVVSGRQINLSRTIGSMIDNYAEYLPDSDHTLIFESESYGKLTITDKSGKSILTRLVSDRDDSILLLSYLVGLLSSTNDEGRGRIKVLAEEFIFLIGISEPTIVWSAPHSSPDYYDVFYAMPEGELVHKEMHATELLHAELVQELHSTGASEDAFELLNELVVSFDKSGTK